MRAFTCHPRGQHVHPHRYGSVKTIYVTVTRTLPCTQIDTQRERERTIHTHIHTVTKNRVIYEGQFSVKLIGFHDVTLGITKNR